MDRKNLNIRPDIVEMLDEAVSKALTVLANAPLCGDRGELSPG
jgi:hypothetical protein